MPDATQVYATFIDGSPATVAESPAALSLRCAHTSTLAEFFALEDDWRELFDHSSFPTPFASWGWASTWWRHFGVHSPSSRARSHISVVTVKDADGRPVAIAPLHRHVTGAGFSWPRRLRVLGDAPYRDAMTEEPVILLRRGRELEASAALLTYLTTQRIAVAWDMAYLRFATHCDAPLFDPKRLRRLLPKTVWDHKSLPAPEIARLASSWEQYRSSLTKSMRDNLSYYPRRLTRHGHDWRVRIVREPTEMPGAAERVYSLHNRRAHSQRGKPHMSHMPGAQQLWLLQQAMAQMASDQMAFVGLLEVDGKIVAAQAFLEARSCLTVYYSGFDPEYYDYSPITIILESVFKEAIARGVRSVNFLPEPAAWKDRWRVSTEASIDELVLSSPTPLGVTRGLGRQISRRVRGEAAD